MKKGKWIILLTICCFLLLGCSSNTSGKLESITFEEYQTLIENKETFALEMWRTTCTHCQSMKPKLQRFIKDYGVTVKTINLDNLSQEEQESMKKIVGTDATPTIFFYQEGEEKSVTTRINGDVSYDRIVEKFQENGFIEAKN